MLHRRACKSFSVLPTHPHIVGRFRAQKLFIPLLITPRVAIGWLGYEIEIIRITPLRSED